MIGGVVLEDIGLEYVQAAIEHTIERHLRVDAEEPVDGGQPLGRGRSARGELGDLEELEDRGAPGVARMGACGGLHEYVCYAQEYAWLRGDGQAAMVLSMSRRFLWTLPLLLLPPGIAAGLVSNGEQEARRPNLLVLYGDDHATRAVGCYGSGLVETPHIDALAEGGVRFSRSFVTNSICGPSRAVFLTGAHSHKNGQKANPPGFRAGQPTFPPLLQEAGYRTAVLGKWHLPGDPVGFDDWELVGGSYYGPSFRSAEGREPSEGHCTELLTGKARAWLEARAEEALAGEAGRPWFLWVSYKATHRTWDPGPRQLELYRNTVFPEPASLFDDYAGRSPGAAASQMRISTDLFPAYDLKLPVTGEGILDSRPTQLRSRMTEEERKVWDATYGPENAAFAEAELEGEDLVRWNYQRYMRDYLRCVAGIDESVGSLVGALEELDLAKDTVVVYTSDQGFFLGEHGWYDKRWMYEPAFATPLVVAGAGIASGREEGALVQNLDLAPTLLHLAGLGAPETMQGESLVPFLRGGTPFRWRDAVYYRYWQRDSGRTSHTVAPHWGIRTARHKLLYVPDFDFWELYDLEADPEEVHNLAGDPDHADLQESLTRRLGELREQYGDEDL